MLSIILSSVEGNTNAPQYTLFEIIFWYSALVLCIVIAIFLLTHRKTNKKKMENLISKLNQDISKYEEIIKNPESKNTLRDVCSRTILILTSFETVFMDLKEKTRSSDFDELIEKKQEIISSIRKLDTKKSKNTVQDAESIRNELLEFKEAMENVKTYLK